MEGSLTGVVSLRLSTTIDNDSSLGDRCSALRVWSFGICRPHEESLLPDEQ